jgi:hypothetical protein
MPKTFDITNERKLTDQDVLVIRAVHIPKSPRFGSVMLAQLFGSQPTIDRVVKRATYRHLHPLLLPGRLIDAGDMTDLGDRDAKSDGRARNKTEYNGARTEIRDYFTHGGYVVGLRGHYEPGDLGTYAARPVRRIITPEGVALRRTKSAHRRLGRMKLKYGPAYNERIALAAVGLTPRMSIEDFDALGGIRRRPKQQAHDPEKSPTVEQEELIRRFGGGA